MKTINFTCDICGSKWINEPNQKITLSLYNNIQFNRLTIPDEKYEDICFKCFNLIRKEIEKIIETRQSEKNKLFKQASERVKSAIERLPIIIPKSFGDRIAEESDFIKSVTYINEFGHYIGTKIKPLNGEIGIYHGYRLVINKEVK